MAKFLDGLGAKKIILQTDVENAIQGVARHMAKEAIPTVTLRTTPRYSHQSNGRVEGMNKTLAGKNTVVNINGFDSRYAWHQN